MKFTNITNPDQCPVDDDVVSIVINGKETTHFWSYRLFLSLLNDRQDIEFTTVTKKGFRELFTLSEQIAFDNFESSSATADSKAMVNTLKQNLFSAESVNVASDEVSQGLDFLISVGVITTDRKAVITSL